MFYPSVWYTNVGPQGRLSDTQQPSRLSMVTLTSLSLLQRMRYLFLHWLCKIPSVFSEISLLFHSLPSTCNDYTTVSELPCSEWWCTSDWPGTSCMEDTGLKFPILTPLSKGWYDEHTLPCLALRNLAWPTDSSSWLYNIFSSPLSHFGKRALHSLPPLDVSASIHCLHLMCLFPSTAL